MQAAPPSTHTWDVFCRVIDNLGDIGVCWRLCAQLAQRGLNVRLWVDDPSALAWMAPGGHPRVAVLRWHDAFDLQGQVPGGVWVEAFGCEPPPVFVAARRAAPVWINLEYLSAEAFVERNHRLPSPVLSGPGQGLTKWFFYPGFTTATGGLLREYGLMNEQARFDRQAWLTDQGVPASAPATRHIALFCYEPPSLPAVMAQAPAHWLVTPGRASAASHALPLPAGAARHALAHLPQAGFDALLWAADLNLVRGEDSLVRALWAGQPFVWQIYPQHDNAHHAKLAAFLDWLDAPASLRAFHRHWNGIDPTPAQAWPGWALVDSWRDCVLAARQRLLAQADLVAQLLAFAHDKAGERKG